MTSNLYDEFEKAEKQFENEELLTTINLSKLYENNITLKEICVKFARILAENENLKQKISNEFARKTILIDNLDAIVQIASSSKETDLIERIKIIRNDIEKENNFEENDPPKEAGTKIAETESKLIKCQKDLFNVEQRSEFTYKLMRIKNERIESLTKFIEKYREKEKNLSIYYENELENRKRELESLNQQCLNLKDDNQHCQLKMNQYESEKRKWMQKFEENEKKYQELARNSLQMQAEFENEKTSLRNEIEKLENLCDKSKNTIVENYLERFFPNFNLIRQTLNRNQSTCEFLSNYFEIKNQNDNFRLEKSVLEERIRSMMTEMAHMEKRLDENQNRIDCFSETQDKLSKLDHETKELRISLKFYQNFANTICDDAKKFRNHFQNLSNYIRILFEYRNLNQNLEENSLETMILRYISELQNCFQEFQELQDEFESKRLDYLKEKHNLIENENHCDQLRTRIQILEAEKKHILMEQQVVQNDLKHQIQMNEALKKDLDKQAQNWKSKLAIVNERNTQLDQLILEHSQRIIDFQVQNHNLQNAFQGIELREKSAVKRLNIQNEIIKNLTGTVKDLKNQIEAQTKKIKELDRELYLNEDMSLKVEDDLKSITADYEYIQKQYEYHLDQEQTLINRLERYEMVTFDDNRFEDIIETLEKNKLLLDQSLIEATETLRKEKERLMRSHQTDQSKWNEEKMALQKNLADIENLYRNEIANRNSIEEKFSKFSTETLQSSSNQTMEDGEKLRLQCTELIQHNKNLVGELNELKNRMILIDKQNQSITEKNRALEIDLISVNDEKSRLLKAMDEIKDKSSNEINQIKANLDRIKADLEGRLEDRAKEIELKNTHLEFFEKQTRSLQSDKVQLNIELNSLKSRVEILDKNSTSIHSSQKNDDMLLNDYAQLKETNDTLRKQLEEYREKSVRCEMQRLRQESQLSSKLKKLNENFNQLENDYQRMIETNEKLSSLNHDFNLIINQLRSELKLQQQSNCNSDENDENIMATNDDGDSVENSAKIDRSETNREGNEIEKEFFPSTATTTISKSKFDLETIVECLTAENKSLQDRYRSFVARENRFKKEIDILETALSKIEDCLLKEQTIIGGHSKLDEKSDLGVEITMTLKHLRDENERLEIRCDGLLNENELLKKRLDGKMVENSNDCVNHQMDSIENNALKNDLEAKENQIGELEKRLNEFETKFSSDEKILQELTIKTTNQQLKIVARKYKAQCDEFRKNIESSSNEDSKNQIEIESQAQSKINSAELETKLNSLTAENLDLRTQISKLSDENQAFRSRSEKMENQPNANQANRGIETQSVLVEQSDNVIYHNPPPQPSYESSDSNNATSTSLHLQSVEAPLLMISPSNDDRSISTVPMTNTNNLRGNEQMLNIVLQPEFPSPITPNLQSASVILDEDQDCIVPSTPTMNPSGGNMMPTTPTLSESVSSFVSVDEFDRSPQILHVPQSSGEREQLNQAPITTTTVIAANQQNDQSNSSYVPSSSNLVQLEPVQGSSSESNTSPLSRQRKLKIHGSTPSSSSQNNPSSS
ncbi:hypothetical protein QR98_0020730 [Sarcoptes scabiei]|uniref:Uncharacterized protein n=1 Tax=Sarcoptes scabiei TaxID=52283 RepID=A0A131ZZV6_SARSC|nr:hypothetical protein QR98_0020730 [Sarcoptes scabiei]